MKGEVRSALLVRGDDDIDTVIDGTTKVTWLHLNGDIKRVWSVGGKLSLSLDKYLKGLETEVDIEVKYDEFYEEIVPIIAIGLVKAF